MAAELGLTIEVGLNMAHRLQLAKVIPEFAQGLAELLDRHAVTRGMVWAGGSKRRLAAQVTLRESPSAELLAQILPAFLQAALKSPSPFPKARTSSEGVALAHSLMVCLGHRVLPVRWGRLESVGTARGVVDPVRIEWLSGGQYRQVLLRANIELDLAERTRTLEGEIFGRVSAAATQFTPPVELLARWAEELEARRLVCFIFSPGMNGLPFELVSQVAMKHRCVALDVATKEGEIQLLAVLDVQEELADKRSALQAEWETARAIYAADFPFDEEPGPRLRRVGAKLATAASDAAVNRLEALCRRLAIELGLPNEVLLQSLRAAPYVRLSRNSALVAAFPRLTLVVTCEAARRLGAERDTIGLLTVLAQASFHGPNQGQPELDAAALLLLADTLDELLAAAERGALPAGPSDPHAARVKGVALLNILLDREWPVGIASLVRIGSANRAFEGGLGAAAASERVVGFLRHRMRVLLREPAVDGVASVRFEGDWDSPVFRRRQFKPPA